MDIFILYFLAAGAFAGILAGLFGIGGGMVIVPALIYIFTAQGIPQSALTHIGIGTSLATIIVTSISSLRAHHSRGAVNWNVWKHMAPGLVIGSLIGAGITSIIHGNSLQVIIGVGAFLVGLKMLLMKNRTLEENDFSKLPSPIGQTGLGGFIGIASAIFGIGGGTLTVPLLSNYGLKIQNAVGTSAACGLPIASAGAIGFLVFGQFLDASIKETLPNGVFGFVHVYAFICVSLASFFTAPIGAKLAHKLPAATLKKAFAVLLLIVGIRLVLDSDVFTI
ncbi:sulfite exporter TauE/SafE family protein [Allomuricauda sp. F6463D]|uniref:sulfite exporter TauE/SafE family protein n=1 Tax=Allomuricauda sp. F6463D TaxID=2926409 RepID=UPI001FF1496F|nr:sulfite exporter TauE/SafE family protein [Muricauda sp. F6463D]MCK0162081.1 sulfite exporter TauE/SafE family protein [Muricauda sp. F6463D]